MTSRPATPPTIDEARVSRPDMPDWALVKLIAFEFELDWIWPGWRPDANGKRLRFDSAPFAYKARIKWLLKKVALLENRTAGVPDPLDWGVMVARDRKITTQCYAHPMIPGEGVVTPENPPPSPLERFNAPAVLAIAPAPETLPEVNPEDSP